MNRLILSSVLSVGILLTLSSQTSASVTEHPAAQNPFRKIEQPLIVKAGVTVAGLALIGFELWWFMGRPKNPADS